jgi:hypothetical protein
LTRRKDKRRLALYVLCAGVLMIVLETAVVNVTGHEGEEAASSRRL